MHARIGSRAACLAVRDAVRSMDEQTTLVQLVERVTVAWRSRLLGHAPSDCAATCLFAMRNRAGRLWIGGIGDGLAAVVMGNGTGPLHVVPLRGGEFGETVALGDGRESLGWVVQEFDDHSASMRALLASDGIANDLAVDQIGSFTNWVVDSFGRLPSRRWREQIRRQLTAWPTLGSIDDRALAVLWPRLESRTCQI